MATTPKIRRVYKGAAIPTTITTSMSDNADAISVAAATGWPTVGPFYAVIDPGLSTEEKIYVGAITGTSLSSITRGVDDTSGVSHASGASIYPVFTATDADEANQLTATYTTKGGLVYMGDPSFTQLAISSTAGHALKVASTGVPEWGQLGSVGIANGAVITEKIDDSAVTVAKLAAAVQNLLVPVGTITAYGGSSAPTGWLLCNGDAFNAVTYPNLNTVLGGATTPDLRGRTPIGAGTGTYAGATARTLGATGGLETHALTAAESGVPGHTHGTPSTPINYQTGGTTAIVVDASGLGIAYATTTNATAAAANAHNNMQPFRVVNFIIKHD